MFSKTCEYAIRALIFIAQKSKDGSRIGIKDISSGIDSPEYFIAKILQDLSRKGFVQSAKGPNGGFYMDDANLEQSVADIVREIDGDKLFSGCGLGLKECSEDHPCPIHNDFKHIRQEIKTMLEESRIQLFVENLDLKLTFLKQ
ncbi:MULTISPECIES: RrF2 family transcriptional regulator [Chryseobacterium]|uniref:HTH-type transcriptional repressor NsrR n=2 Tax=Chryseobacterium gleum TaxID=250 RepID=A0A448AZH0_CHRGE|nr:MULTISPECIES: Rrf2 family transcriptional regulator [Chryseobacterium]AZB32374.1 Rrf2 family transcriptional regulator [Chryseobacterium bernardetii]EFK34149.1 transcriptional regulator, Rrf2 family [Chryseobacterium gleum ATCC 35910]MDG4654322.1 Rrf2 family transcriptional regulator [Chryseobacterium arthrosphaerae]QQY30026.1 Rrf2 family transcriptional regulator [Chryseobacterium gleum]TLX26341.1 Rrf2 family transcriptional regulator [Chryseobacterium indologenes]